MSLSRKELLRAYRRMRTIRAFAERTGASLPSHPIASIAAIGMALTPDDHVCAASRDPAYLLGTGTDPVDALLDNQGPAAARIRARVLADLEMDEPETGPACQVLAGACPAFALGTALAARTHAKNAMAVCFLEDVAAARGETFEAFEAARALGLPILFVVPRGARDEDLDPPNGQPARPASDFVGRAVSFGLPASAARAEDFFSIHHEAATAVERARTDQEPSVLELVCHGQDCLEQFRAKVVQADLFAPVQLDTVDREVTQGLDALLHVSSKHAPPLGIGRRLSQGGLPS